MMDILVELIKCCDHESVVMLRLGQCNVLPDEVFADKPHSLVISHSISS